MEIAKTYGVDEEFFDETVSGTVAEMNREGFSKMVEFFERAIPSWWLNSIVLAEIPWACKPTFATSKTKVLTL